MLNKMRITWWLARDHRVAPRLKVAILALALLYVVSPIDAIPDFLIGAGQVDDVGVIFLALLALVRLVPRFAPPEIFNERLESLGILRSTGSRHERRSPPERVIDATFRVRE